MLSRRQLQGFVGSRPRQATPLVRFIFDFSIRRTFWPHVEDETIPIFDRLGIILLFFLGLQLSPANFPGVKPFLWQPAFLFDQKLCQLFGPAEILERYEAAYVSAAGLAELFRRFGFGINFRLNSEEKHLLIATQQRSND